MTDASGEVNLQSKQDIICHVAKGKLATSDYMANVIPFLMSVILALVLRFKLLILKAKRSTVFIFHSGCIFSVHRSAVCSLQSAVLVFYAIFCVRSFNKRSESESHQH